LAEKNLQNRFKSSQGKVATILDPNSSSMTKAIVGVFPKSRKSLIAPTLYIAILFFLLWI
jgi:hypothetical protein